MDFSTKYGIKKSFWQSLLLGVPAIIFCHFILNTVNQHFALVHADTMGQTIAFAIGIIGSIALYGTKAFRFGTTFILLIVLLFILRFLFNHTGVRNIDIFIFGLQLYIYCGLLAIGWLVGFGFCRWRLFSIIWPIGILSLFVYITTKGATLAENTLTAFFLLLLYSVYCLFVSELLRRTPSNQPKLGIYATKKTLIFTIIASIVLFVLFNLFEKRFEKVKQELAKGSFDQKHKSSLTKQNADGTMSNSDGMKLDGGLNKGKQLLFVAHLHNYMPDSTTPNPLYFTSTYYTKFDESTQTFETDSLRPLNDLYSPDPTTIPLYFTAEDSSVIRNGMSTMSRHTVTTEVFKTLLSPHSFVAPSTAYACQPISVPSENADQYKSAYTAKMWVSDLNSAYFIYNPAKNEMLQSFQQERFNQLRTQNNYASIPADFVKYYTKMPSDKAYERITKLAQQITQGKATTIDKMIAIRDYFLSADTQGKPLYQYSDNPGIPGMPSASKLNYFLFENRKGYCAYFAGATLFMLRSLGVPSRVVAGFMTIDRSSKNPGWYWFYADQAHAWVQVYFPEYGWIDFDTTIPDANTRQSSQPDGTPPMGQTKSYFVADGIIQNINNERKTIRLRINKLMINDKNISIQESPDADMDLSLARILADTGQVNIDALKTEMHVTTASSASSLMAIHADSTTSANEVLAQAQQPIPIDAVKIINVKEKEQTKETQNIASSSTKKIVYFTLIAFLLLFLFLPYGIWIYLKLSAKKSPFAAFRASEYYLFLMGYSRGDKSPLEYAADIDRFFETDYIHFITTYQQWKYSGVSVSEESILYLNNFNTSFIQKIKQKIPFKKRILHFLNIGNALDYFTNK